MSGIFDSGHVRRAFGRAAATYIHMPSFRTKCSDACRSGLKICKSPPKPFSMLAAGLPLAWRTALRKRYPKAQTIRAGALRTCRG